MQERTSERLRTYFHESESFVPMLRIEDAIDPGEKGAVQSQNAQVVKRLENPINEQFDADINEDFSAIKAEVWGRMAPGQIQQHLLELRQTAEERHKAPRAEKPDSQSSRILYYHCDHLGTPRELTDDQGKLVWSVMVQAYSGIGHGPIPARGTRVAKGNYGQCREVEKGV